MQKKPIIRDRRRISDTGIFNIEEIDLEFSNGASRRYQRIVGSQRGAVMVVPLLDPQTVLLIREYAAGTERYELAFPKGSIEPDEDPLLAANRELREETGYRAQRLERVSTMSIAPGYLRHTTHIVLARELYPDRLAGDEPEPIEVVPWKLCELEQLLARDDFSEARSIAAFYIIRDRVRTTN
jgi:ADP-ribose diphosphatase